LILNYVISDKKVTPFGGMKLHPKSNAGYNPLDIIQGFWLSIFTEASRYIHADWLRYDTTLQSICESPWE